MLIDVHTHLDQYANSELPSILERASSVGVGPIVVAGTTIDSSKAIVDLAKHHTRILASVGIHPSEVRSPTSLLSLSELKVIASDPEVIAISEIGLDYLSLIHI